MFPAAYPQVKRRLPTTSQSSNKGEMTFRCLAQKRPRTAKVAVAVKTTVIMIVRLPSSVKSLDGATEAFPVIMASGSSAYREVGWKMRRKRRYPRVERKTEGLRMMSGDPTADSGHNRKYAATDPDQSMPSFQNSISDGSTAALGFACVQPMEMQCYLEANSEVRPFDNPVFIRAAELHTLGHARRMQSSPLGCGVVGENFKSTFSI
jgi:hypothetical protein